MAENLILNNDDNVGYNMDVISEVLADIDNFTLMSDEYKGLI